MLNTSISPSEEEGIFVFDLSYHRSVMKNLFFGPRQAVCGRIRILYPRGLFLGMSFSMTRWKAYKRSRLNDEERSLVEANEKTARQISLGRATKPLRRHSVGRKGVNLSR